MSESIGKTIRKLRRDRGMTQEELAEQLSVSAQAISKWENNLGMPDISQVVPLAHFFHVSTDTIFGLSEATENNSIDSIIQKATASESPFEEYKILKDALRTFPGDTRLLSELLSCGQCLLSDGKTVTENERTAIYEECEKAGLLVLSYSKEMGEIYYVTQWLVRLYCEMGDTGKASTMAEKLPENTAFNRQDAFGRIYAEEKNYIPSAEQYEVNFSLYCREVLHCLLMSGNMYARAGDKANAVTSFRNAILIGQLLMSENTLPLSPSAKKNMEKQIAQCQKSVELLTVK